MMGKAQRLFISAAFQDLEWTKSFVSELRKGGFDVWLDEEAPSMAESLFEEFQTALRSSEFFIFVVGSKDILTPNMAFELGVALGTGKPVIGIVPKDLADEDLPSPIKVREHLIMESPQETAREVAEALTKTG